MKEQSWGNGMRHRSSRRRAFVAFSGVLMSVFLSGCGKRGVDVREVTGRVTYKGQPLAGALVMFRPKSGGGRVASGYTRDDGRYELITSGATAGGAMPGEYDVLISKTIEVDDKGSTVAHSLEKYDPAAAPPAPTTQKSVIPAKYNAPRGPVLSATVTDRNNNFEFDLKD